MRAVICSEVGDPDVLEIVERPRPELWPGEVLVRVFATALNRADLLQRRGLYPPPEGVTDVLGLEFAGEVADAGDGSGGFEVGDSVCGLVPGGGYADFVGVPATEVLRIPETLSYDAAAAIPEAYSTALESLIRVGGLAYGESVLVHAGASGVGSAAIQLARATGARVFTTVSSKEKAKLCRKLGAERAVLYREESFADVVRAEVPGGVDVVLDLVGAKHWEENARALREGGRHVLIGLVGGARVEVNLGVLIRKRLRLLATNLRHRSADDRAAIAADIRELVLPRVETGELVPVMDRVFPFDEVRAAHEYMETNANRGKIVLRL